MGISMDMALILILTRNRHSDLATESERFRSLEESEQSEEQSPLPSCSSPGSCQG